MRKIDEEASSAFYAKKKYRLGNTIVNIEGNKPCLYLHGNKIATMNDDGELMINHCGWETRTTASRLNSLYGVKIRISDGQFVLNEMGYMPDGWVIIK